MALSLGAGTEDLEIRTKPNADSVPDGVGSLVAVKVKKIEKKEITEERFKH